jgi:hypothetical protein
MPRKQVPLEQKKFPRTTGLTIQARCGHEYVRRISTGWLGGAFKTADNLKRYSEMLEQQTAWLKESVCLECFAKESLNTTSSQESQFCETLRIDSLPELKGTEKVLAFARSIRARIFADVVYDESRAMSRTFRYPSLGDRLIIESLYAARVITPVSDRTPMVELTYQFSKLTSDFMGVLPAKFGEGQDIPVEIQQRALAMWLVCRHAVLSSDLVSDFFDARWWLMRAKGKYTPPRARNSVGLFDIPNLRVHTYAMLVARMDCWNDPMDAYRALEMFLGEAEDAPEVFSAAAEETPFGELIEQIQIMNALRPKPSESHWGTPF